MTTFNYAILTPDKTTVTGTCDAERFEDALARLEEKGVEVLSLVAVDGETSAVEQVRNRTMNLEVLRTFQAVLQREGKHPKALSDLQDLISGVTAGEGLTEAIETRRAALPEPLSGLVRAGRRDELVRRIVARLVNQLEHAADLRRKAIRSVCLAVFETAVFFAFILFIAGFVLPYFREIFGDYLQPQAPKAAAASVPESDSGESTPIPDWIAHPFGAPSVVWFFIVPITVLGVALAMRGPAAAVLVRRLARTIPLVGPSMSRLRLARFMIASSAFLRSGAGFEIAGRSSRNAEPEAGPVEAEEIDGIAGEREYEEALRGSGLLTAADLRRLETGRERNNLETVIGSLSSGVAHRAESAFQGAIFLMMEAVSIVALIVALFIVVFLIVLPIIDLIPAVLSGRGTAIEP